MAAPIAVRIQACHNGRSLPDPVHHRELALAAAQSAHANTKNAGAAMMPGDNIQDSTSGLP
ncbi:hypothetical protein [Methylobacter luteus]|uniref:hypothetical protein n=1 Tax=Methylobacter luteus TaxID=415 RepID=UPI000429F53F|nr:hypothetical protein [Methylobacter luteus]